MTGTDQAGCNHEFVVSEVVIGIGAELVEECMWCGATALTPSQQSKRMRLPEPPGSPRRGRRDT